MANLDDIEVYMEDQDCSSSLNSCPEISISAEEYFSQSQGVKSSSEGSLPVTSASTAASTSETVSFLCCSSDDFQLSDQDNAEDMDDSGSGSPEPQEEDYPDDVPLFEGSSKSLHEAIILILHFTLRSNSGVGGTMSRNLCNNYIFRISSPLAFERCAINELKLDFEGARFSKWSLK